MFIFTKIDYICQFLSAARAKGSTIGFVPTMGALHKGHVSLIQASANENNVTVCSIFVNPTQFNNPTDLEKYPRLIEKDILLLQQNGCHILFYPSVDEMYSAGQQLLDIDLKGTDQRLEGEHRPGHFKGVATVVKKLLDIVEPDRAYFGEKDYQQVLVVRTMAEATGLKTDIVSLPTIREESGLAMSSRNLRLAETDYRNASVIYKALQWAKENIGTVPVAEIEQKAIAMINAVPYAKVEYFELADAQTLEHITEYKTGQGVVALVATTIGGVRLIDNMVVNPDE